jgi:hypothetical protein
MTSHAKSRTHIVTYKDEVIANPVTTPPQAFCGAESLFSAGTMPPSEDKPIYPIPNHC